MRIGTEAFVRFATLRYFIQEVRTVLDRRYSQHEILRVALQERPVVGVTARHLLKQGKQVQALVRNREKAARWADQGGLLRDSKGLFGKFQSCRKGGRAQPVDATPSDVKVVIMRQGRRYGLSAAQRIDIWRLWKAGESLHEIGRAFGKDHGSIQFLLSKRGGIAPPVRRRSLRTLTLDEREDISRGIASGSSIREIAKGLQRPVSTVSREVARHGGRPLYRANEADHHAWESALRPKVCLLANHETLRTIVASKLILDWSPEQISKWLKVHYPNNENMRVSHETIYRSLFIQARGVLKKELVQHLRSKRSIRRSRHSRAAGQSRGQIVDAISISERPAEVEDRAIPGHWEGDLLAGSKNSHIATLVERHSRFAMLIKVPSKDTTTVVAALSKHVRKLPATLRRSVDGVPGSGHEEWPNTKASRWTQRMSKSTSAIRRVLATRHRK